MQILFKIQNKIELSCYKNCKLIYYVICRNSQFYQFSKKSTFNSTKDNSLEYSIDVLDYTQMLIKDYMYEY